MISCTEFIPAYSELFKFLDEKSGRQAVYDYWTWCFQPEKSQLYVHLVKSGFAGAWDYWSTIATEEACDVTRVYNEKEGWSISCMHACPSKGRFAKLGYLEPFDEYCEHCNCYNIALEKKGFAMIRDHRTVDRACCRSVLINKAVFKGNAQEMLDKMHQCELNGCTATTTGCPFVSENTKMLNVSSEHLRYFHPSFHMSMNNAAGYILVHYGMEGLNEYLTKYTLAYHAPLIQKIKKDGLQAVEDYLLWLYNEEGAADALTIDKTSSELSVSVQYCPGVKFIKEVRNCEPHAAYEHCTDMVYHALAEASGIGFEMQSYDPVNGAAKFRFYIP